MTATTSVQEPFPLNLRTDLIKLLEPEDRLHNNNWKQVANYLRLPYREIPYLESQRGTRYGPMELLLQMWEHENKTLQEFKNLMKDIKRFDVVARIEIYERLFRSDLPGPPYPIARRVHQTFRVRRGPRPPQRPVLNDLNRVKSERGRLPSNPVNGGRPTARWHQILRQTSSN